MKFIKAAILALACAIPPLFGRNGVTTVHLYISPTSTKTVTFSATLMLSKDPFTPGQCAYPIASISVIDTATSATVSSLRGNWSTATAATWSASSGSYSAPAGATENVTWTVSLGAGNYDVQFTGEDNTGGGGDMNMDWGNESQSGAPVTVFPPTAGVTVDGTVSGGIVSDGSRTIHFTAHDPQGLLQSVTTYSWNQTYGYTIEYGSSYPVSGTNADVPRVQWLTPGNWYFWTNATSSSGLNGVGPGTNAAAFWFRLSATAQHSFLKPCLRLSTSAKHSR